MHLGQSATEELARRHLAVRRLAGIIGAGYPLFMFMSGAGGCGGYRGPPDSAAPAAGGRGGHPRPVPNQPMAISTVADC
jgi:hypothetical protein